VVFDGSDEQVRRSYLSMHGELRKALEAGEFELDYQPKLDLRSGLIVGVESLVRWNHRTRGRVPPGEFIPFAEQTGFMRQITRWVVRDGLRFGAELARAGLNLRVSINVTAGDIQERGFADEIAEIVRSLKVPSDCLCLEITESGVVSESEAALETLQAISKMGIKLSVDDFGTGYSTLKQLQQLPVQELKIDRSFVLGILDNHGSETIVRSTIDLARHMGLRVVAEGVENVRQMRALAALGCHEVQGYFLAKPMRAVDLVSWVQMRHALHASSREMYFGMLTGK
jgi:EAL domain-containing protein (putative c-di-GMP-specific phosphodiesterase class I)